MITIIALQGKTSSGKDSAARYIREIYGIEPVISFATRPIRDSEVEGREHYFINDAQMDEIVKDEASMLAFVQFPKTGYRYCASTRDLKDGATMTYIIDPSGLQWLKDHRPDVKVISLFFDLPEEIIKERALKRGDNLIDIEARLDSEREMFDSFKNSGVYDVRIDTDDTPDNVNQKIREALEKFDIMPL